MASSEFTRGVYAGLRRAAELTREARKLRSAPWLDDCAEIALKQGYDAPWPPAPAYKGPVVLVDDPGPGLAQLDSFQLDALRLAVRLECDRRGPEGMP